MSSEESRVRKKKIMAWLSDEEHALLMEKMKYAGLTISGYVRKIVKDGAVVVADKHNLKNLVYELNRIGNNVNQIARRVNERDVTIEMDVADLRNQVERMNEMIIDAIMGAD